MNELHFFSVSRPGEIIELAPMSPNTTHQNQNFDDVQELSEIGENLTGNISEPLKESETALDGDQDNCDANTFLETVQVHSESEGNSFSQNT